MGSKVKFEVDVIWEKGDLIVLVSRMRALQPSYVHLFH